MSSCIDPRLLDPHSSLLQQSGERMGYEEWCSDPNRSLSTRERQDRINENVRSMIKRRGKIDGLRRFFAALGWCLDRSSSWWIEQYKLESLRIASITIDLAISEPVTLTWEPTCYIKAITFTLTSVLAPASCSAYRDLNVTPDFYKDVMTTVSLYCLGDVPMVWLALMQSVKGFYLHAASWTGDDVISSSALKELLYDRAKFLVIYSKSALLSLTKWRLSKKVLPLSFFLHSSIWSTTVLNGSTTN